MAKLVEHKKIHQMQKVNQHASFSLNCNSETDTAGDKELNISLQKGSVTGCMFWKHL